MKICEKLCDDNNIQSAVENWKLRYMHRKQAP